MEPTADPGKDNAMAAVQRWRALLDTQMHFNAMIVQTRAIGMSVIIAVFGAAALSLARAPDRFFVLPWISIPLAAVVMIFALLLLVALFVLEYFYYYPLLLTVVERTERIEVESQQAGSAIAFDLTSALSKRVSARRAAIVLAFFYGVPLLTGCLFLTYVMSLRP
jgi:hypothetical protein